MKVLKQGWFFEDTISLYPKKYFCHAVLLSTDAIYSFLEKCKEIKAFPLEKCLFG